MTRKRTWTLSRWCPRCVRSVPVTVEMLTEMPARGVYRDRWIEAAVREIVAKFEREHAVTCGRQAT